MIEWNRYPLVLNVNHIKEILGIGRNVAYDLLYQVGFPVVKVGGRSLRVPRDEFRKWLEEKSRVA
jgi:excisionase family DNA binding protein